MWEIEESKEGEGRMVSVESSAVEAQSQKKTFAFDVIIFIILHSRDE